MFRSIGPTELLIILAIVVVLFGATRIGDISKGIGRGIREFRREVREGQEDVEEKKAVRAESGEAKAESSEERKSYPQH